MTASITGSSAVTAANDVSVTAQSNSRILADDGGATLTGTAGISAVAPAVGAGIADSTFTDSTTAFIDASQVTATTGTVLVSAFATPDVEATAFGVAVSTALALNTAAAGAGSGASANNSITNTVAAYIQDGSTVLAGAAGGSAVNVSALDTPTYSATSGSGSLGFSLGKTSVALAIGVALSTNTVTSTVQAYIGALNGTDPTTVTAPAGGMQVSTTSSQAVMAKSVAVSATIAIPLNPDDPVSVALSGTGANASNNVTNKITAAVAGGATIDATGAASIKATETPHIDAEGIGGALSLGVVSVAVAGTVTSSTLNENVASYVGNNSSITASSLTIEAFQAADAANDPTTSSSSIAGTGGLLLGADAATSTASTVGTVTAYTGTGVTLPSGDVTVLADSQPVQSANSTGVAAGGLAAGGNTSTATSNVQTSAVLGADSMNSSRTGALIVLALGLEQNTAKAVAGSGGLIAGACATTDIADQSTALAGLGGGTISAGAVVVAAINVSGYAPDADSYQAAVLGGSGAVANTDLATSATTTIGDDTSITASGPVIIAAQNAFQENRNGPSVKVGAGGVINGNAGISQTTLDGAQYATPAGVTYISPPPASDTTDVSAGVFVGQSVTITSGTNPFSKSTAGGITLLAASYVNANDLATISTGGVTEFSGTNSTINATVNNGVFIGASDQFNSYGEIGIGTYSTIIAQANSEGNTWGLAAQPNAIARTTVTSNQAISVGANTTMNAFANITLTAGKNPLTGMLTLPSVPSSFNDPNLVGAETQALEPSATSITALANAQAYTEALEGIPTATAHTSVTSNAALTIASGVIITAGQNATIGAYSGGIDAVEEIVARYSAIFIPISNPNATQVTPTTSATVAQNGTITAGADHALSLTIPNDDSDGGFFSSTLNVGFSGPLSEPILSQYLDPFTAGGPNGFVANNFTGTDEMILNTGVSNQPVGAWELGTLFNSAGTGITATNQPLFASGGSAIVDGALTGSGSITAYGGATITIADQSPDYIVLGPIQIPAIGGGQVTVNSTSYTSSGSVGGVNLAPSGANTPPAVNIDLSYPGDVGDVSFGPALFLAGPVNNTGGNLTITNQMGSYGQIGTISAQSVTLNVPNGTGVISTPTSPYQQQQEESQWNSQMLWPGGNPYAAGYNGGNPTAAISYVVNALYNPGGTLTEAQLNGGVGQGLYNRVNDHAGPNNQVQSSIVFVGDSFPYVTNSGDSNNATNSQLSQDAGNPSPSPYQVDGASGGAYFPNIPVLSLTQSVTDPLSAYPSTGNAIQSYGGGVSITALSIDLNGQINVGAPTPNWSVSLSASLGSVLSTYQQMYSSGQVTNPVFDIPQSDLAPVSSGDNLITATYNAATQQITIDNLTAGLHGGFVNLNGQIISTNPQAQITFNDGLGQVTIDNQTGIPVVVQNIETGHPSSSGVVINDTAKGQETVYSYVPGQPIQIYTGALHAPLTALTLSATQTGTSTAYSPEAGLRWQWTDTANLSRSVNFFYNGSFTGSTPELANDWLTPWQWQSSNANPWTQGGLVIGDGTNWTVNSQSVSATPIVDQIITLTDNNASEARDVWYNTTVATGSFTATFTYQASGDKAADGAAFVFQTQGTNALGYGANYLGYGGGNTTGPSAAYEINIYGGNPGSLPGTNFVTNGSTGIYNSTGSVNFASGDPVQVVLTYDATAQTLTEQVTDLITAGTYSHVYTNINLASLLGPTAYIGFTGGSGGYAATQTIRNFNFQSSAGTPGVILNSSLEGTALHESISATQNSLMPVTPLVTALPMSIPAYQRMPQNFSDNSSTYTQTSDLISYNPYTYMSDSFGYNNFRHGDGKPHYNYWNYYWPLTASLTLTTSVKADYPFGINFAAITPGAININSNAPVYLAGTIDISGGSTSINAVGSITQSAGASISTGNLTLTTSSPTAGSGSIGTASQPIVARLQTGGVLNAISAGNQGVYLKLGSGAIVERVASGSSQNGYGDLVINAAGSLIAQPWVGSTLPAGATPITSDGTPWTWVSSNPSPYFDTQSNQSDLATGFHESYFLGTSNPLVVEPGDTLYAYAYLDPANPPTEVMLQWFGNGTWQRAYWGPNDINEGTAVSMGALPAAGKWVPLLIPASLLGLDGTTVTGLAFSLEDGQATFNFAGTVNISGANITLNSATGQVGNNTNPLFIQPNITRAANGGVQAGVVNATAAGDIGLVQLTGDLLAGQIVSTNGSVYLNAASGSILNAGTWLAAAPSLAEAEQVWQDLGLSDPNHSQATVLAFENLVASNYQRYWQLVNNGTVQNSSYAVLPGTQLLWNTATAGTFTLSVIVNGQTETTAAIAFNASASAVQTALDQLSGVQAIVTGSGTPADPWVISGTGLVTLSAADQLSGGNSTVQAVPAGSQQLWTNATGGTFTLSMLVNGQTETTGPIAFNASAATIQAALNQLPGVQTSVTGLGTVLDPWLVASAGLSPITVDTSQLTAAAVLIAQPPPAGTVALWNCATGGTFTISINVNGQTETTTPIAFNATAAALQSALNLLTGAPVNVTGSGTAADPWLIQGPLLAGLSTDDSLLVGGVSTVASIPTDATQLSTNGTGGSFTISLSSNGTSQQTAPIAFNASAATVQAALNQLAGVSVKVTGLGTPSDPWLIVGSGLAGLGFDTSQLIGAVAGGGYVLSATGVSAYSAQAAAALGGSTPSNVEVQTYANGVFQNLAAFFQTNLPAGWMSLPEFQQYNSAFQYTATANQTVQLTTQPLTESQLIYAVNANALNPASAGTAASFTPNVAGKSVTLVSAADVGKTLTSLAVSLNHLQTGTTTALEQLYLAQATRPGEALVQGTNAQGQTVTFPINNPPAGIDVDGVLLTFSRPLVVSVPNANALNVTAYGGVNIILVGLVSVGPGLPTGSIAQVLLGNSTPNAPTQTGGYTDLVGRNSGFTAPLDSFLGNAREAFRAETVVGGGFGEPNASGGLDSLLDEVYRTWMPRLTDGMDALADSLTASGGAFLAQVESLLDAPGVGPLLSTLPTQQALEATRDVSQAILEGWRAAEKANGRLPLVDDEELLPPPHIEEDLPPPRIEQPSGEIE